MTHCLRVGVGGPVGSGKTALLRALCSAMREKYNMAVVTNDIYTKEDQEILTRAGALPAERIVGVETGGCPHTAIREDASINLAAIADLRAAHPDLDVVLIESDICGAGASGRNGGFILSWWAKFSTLKKLCGDEEALRLAQASAQAVREIGTFCDTHGIDAHYRYDGWLWAATSPAQIGAWDSVITELDQHGLRP